MQLTKTDFAEWLNSHKYTQFNSSKNPFLLFTKDRLDCISVTGQQDKLLLRYSGGLKQQPKPTWMLQLEAHLRQAHPNNYRGIDLIKLL